MPRFVSQLKHHLILFLFLFILVGCEKVIVSDENIPPSSTPSPIYFKKTLTPAPTEEKPSLLATPTSSSATIELIPSIEPSTNPSRPWRIMPLGDSLTSGNYPGRVHSYRGYLEGLLRKAGYHFDFVGTQSRMAHYGTDLDHEGHSGYTIGPDLARFCEECETANLYDHLEAYLQTKPDIILLMIGINDLLPLDVRPVKPEDAPGKLAGLVRRIQELRPGVYIFLASLAPVNYRDEMQWPAFQAVNQSAEVIAEGDAKDRIYFVDVNQILEQTLDTEIDFADGIHLAEGGARKLALAWFDALRTSGILEPAPPEP